MKPYTFSTKSWMFRLANFGSGGMSRVPRDTDLCSLTRAMIAGSFGVLIVSLALLLLTTMIGITLWNTYDMIFHGAAVLAPTIIVYGVLASFVLLVAGVWSKRKVGDYLYDRRLATRSNKQHTPSIVSLWYSKFKDKTCVRIRFEGDR